jgi:hypothetical protein
MFFKSNFFIFIVVETVNLFLQLNNRNLCNLKLRTIKFYFKI